MQHSTLTAPLIVCGILSIILQVVGFFSPAWMIYNTGVDTDTLEVLSGAEIGASRKTKIDIRMGLWTTSACYDLGYGRECGSVSTADIEETLSSNLNPGAQKLLEDWIALQLMAVLAGMFAIMGLIALYVLDRASDEKVLCNAGTVTVSWLLSAILILAAVGKNANDQHAYSVGSDVLDGMDMGFNLKFELPWATIMSGLGGGFAAVVAIVMALYLICKDRREAPGVWRKFDDGKPI